MSRALDRDSTSQNGASDPAQVYREIAQALRPRSESLLEIEFLGKSHPLPDGCHVLVDGNSVGVSKAKLVQAFVVARALLFTYSANLVGVAKQDVRDATSVLLLMDAENITAANTRKRLIQICREDPMEALEEVLAQELLWVDGMLTSRLHRHTKSPTLWGHRRWVLEVCGSMSRPYDMYKDLEEVVMVSAERHPRNYYAWQHMRWILQNQQRHSQELLSLDDARLVYMVLQWCTRHPSDTSGFSFMMYCLFYLPEGSRSRIEVCSSVCKKVLNLAASFQWTHESVWAFLRTVVTSGCVVEEQKAEFYKLRACLPAQNRCRLVDGPSSEQSD